jgi:hypothetical protein
MPHVIKDEAVLIEISIENYKKLSKIREDTQFGRDENSRGMPTAHVTLDDVIAELTYGKY